MAAGTWGPYQYYSYGVVAGKNVPDGNPITISGNVTFAAGGGCPGGLLTAGAAQPYPTFPTYIFYGGMNALGNLTLGPGQYVMAGTNGSNGSYVLNARGGTITGDTATGTMIILTDANYPGLGTPVTAGLPTQLSNISTVAGLDTTNITSLLQGSMYMKDATVTLSGVVNSTTGSSLPVSMDSYTGIAFWQDRRNSTVEYNDYPTIAPNCPNTSCTTDDGTVVGCANVGAASAGGCAATQTNAEIVTDNHVTQTSPGINLDPGNGSFTVTGAFYQPRGAWVSITHGTAFGAGGFQVITGSLELTSGNDKLLLQGPTNPIITYKAVLIR